MRVLYVIDSLAGGGGAEQSLRSLAPELVRRGIDLHVSFAPRSEDLSNELEDAGATLHPRKPTSRVEAVRFLRADIGDIRPDLVHTTLFEADVAGRIAAARARVPVVSSLVNVTYGSDQRPPGVRRSRYVGAHLTDLATARVVRRFHALTEVVADTMSKRLRVDRDRIDVIPRGRSRAEVGAWSPERRAQVRRALGIDDGTPVVLVAARQEHQKGVDLALQAWPAIHRARPDAVLLLAGRHGSASARIDELATPLERTGSLRRLGNRSDVPDLLCACDALVMPSRWEGMGSLFIEAMALGTPVVASRIAPIEEVAAQAHVAGWPEFAEVGHPAALASACTDLLATPDALRQERATAAVAAFEEGFTSSVIGARMRAFYDRAIA